MMKLAQCVILQVPCPCCRRPFQSGTDLPVNYVIQDVIAETVRSNEGLCQSCYAERRLELAEVRCEHCQERLCDGCGVEHTQKKHALKSLLEKQCDRHERKLELFCVRCQSNVCVVCFLEDHRNHECDTVDKVAEQLTSKLNVNMEKLGSRVQHLKSTLDTITNQKKRFYKF